MNTFKEMPFFILLSLILPLLTLNASEKFRFDKDKVIQRKSLSKAYARFNKVYKPYVADQSNLKPHIAKQLEKLFSLSDMAVIEKVLLLEFIGKIHEGELARDTPYKDYYEEILNEIALTQVSDERVEKVKSDLINGINYHIEVLDAWLEAARKNQVHKVKNKNGRWVHPGTSSGDKIFYSLYHQYIKKNFSKEYPENLEALSRHLCVLVF